MGWGAVEGVDHQLFVVSGEEVQVVVGVDVADFGEEVGGVVAVVDDVAEEDEVMRFGWGVGEGEVEAAEVAVEVGDGDRGEMVVWHGFTVGGRRVWPCGIFVFAQNALVLFW